MKKKVNPNECAACGMQLPGGSAGRCPGCGAAQPNEQPSLADQAENGVLAAQAEDELARRNAAAEAWAGIQGGDAPDAVEPKGK